MPDNNIPSTNPNPFEQLTKLAESQKDQQAQQLKDARSHDFALAFARLNVQLLMQNKQSLSEAENLECYRQSYEDAKKLYLKD
ncbi:hypothetical protein [Furfurilactobacillus curtus]|uniref:Uncharacterized protein n=1 Tax=Furfurilactobacillus curtus TaxID=1746200 RepID=A0ABQ5JQJ7_9LACO